MAKADGVIADQPELDVVASSADSPDDDAGLLPFRLMDVRSSLVAGMLSPTADALGTVYTD